MAMWPLAAIAAATAAVAGAAPTGGRWSAAADAAYGYTPQVTSRLPQEYIRDTDLPESFTWGNVSGANYLTRITNQHLPQYCGACWGHASMSALADRIKIARGGHGMDITLSVQHVLNCGDAGSCHGGYQAAAYDWIYRHPEAGVAYESCNPYLACSADSDEGVCAHFDTTCTPANVCKTCNKFTASGGFCTGLDKYPNATVAEHGSVTGEAAMMKEIFARGPIACDQDGEKVHQYTGGVANGTCGSTNHVVSVVGWGVDNDGPAPSKFWWVRNSWGEYWGDMGFFKVARGDPSASLCLEDHACYWATPRAWTETNFPCGEDGARCNGAYQDPGDVGVGYGTRHARKNA